MQKIFFRLFTYSFHFTCRSKLPSLKLKFLASFWETEYDFFNKSKLQMTSLKGLCASSELGWFKPKWQCQMFSYYKSPKNTNAKGNIKKCKKHSTKWSNFPLKNESKNLLRNMKIECGKAYIVVITHQTTHKLYITLKCYLLTSLKKFVHRLVCWIEFKDTSASCNFYNFIK